MQRWRWRTKKHNKRRCASAILVQRRGIRPVPLGVNPKLSELLLPQTPLGRRGRRKVTSSSRGRGTHPWGPIKDRRSRRSTIGPLDVGVELWTRASDTTRASRPMRAGTWHCSPHGRRARTAEERPTVKPSPRDSTTGRRCGTSPGQA